jgi:hypothetical protein
VKVMATALDNYIKNSYQGSLLAMKSRDAIIWSLLLKLGNLALVVMVRRFRLLSMVIVANMNIFPRMLPSGKSHLLRKSRPQFPDTT